MFALTPHEHLCWVAIPQFIGHEKMMHADLCPLHLGLTLSASCATVMRDAQITYMAFLGRSRFTYDPVVCMLKVGE